MVAEPRALARAIAGAMPARSAQSHCDLSGTTDGVTITALGCQDADVDDALTVLRREFESAEAGFLLRLRGDGLVWDRASFSRLERAMRTACEQYVGREDLPRWMAEGFYEVSHFVAEWTSHPNFPQPEPVQCYKDCLARLRDLADWFFRGWHAYQEPHVWCDL